MLPIKTDSYENGGVRLDVMTYEQQVHESYFLQVQNAGVSLSNKDFEDLRELMRAWEAADRSNHYSLYFILGLVFLLVVPIAWIVLL